MQKTIQGRRGLPVCRHQEIGAKLQGTVEFLSALRLELLDGHNQKVAEFCASRIEAAIREVNVVRSECEDMMTWTHRMEDIYRDAGHPHTVYFGGDNASR